MERKSSASPLMVLIVGVVIFAVGVLIGMSVQQRNSANTSTNNSSSTSSEDRSFVGLELSNSGTTVECNSLDDEGKSLNYSCGGGTCSSSYLQKVSCKVTCKTAGVTLENCGASNLVYTRVTECISSSACQVASNYDASRDTEFSTTTSTVSDSSMTVMTGTSIKVVATDDQLYYNGNATAPMFGQFRFYTTGLQNTGQDVRELFMRIQWKKLDFTNTKMQFNIVDGNNYEITRSFRPCVGFTSTTHHCYQVGIARKDRARIRENMRSGTVPDYFAQLTLATNRATDLAKVVVGVPGKTGFNPTVHSFMTGRTTGIYHLFEKVLNSRVKIIRL